MDFIKLEKLEKTDNIINILPKLTPRKCSHNRRKSKCKECRGASICEHRRVKSRCKECKCKNNIDMLLLAAGQI